MVVDRGSELVVDQHHHPVGSGDEVPGTVVGVGGDPHRHRCPRPLPVCRADTRAGSAGSIALATGGVTFIDGGVAFIDGGVAFIAGLVALTGRFGVLDALVLQRRTKVEDLRGTGQGVAVF
ncbi:hypothetical protein, partial [Actinomycetospora sp.]|uniref:hypothetical protein n=1 Tax=Actinomycetospora sp. TaxID=1872135 RepID=UPI002F424EA1